MSNDADIWEGVEQEDDDFALVIDSTPMLRPAEERADDEAAASAPADGPTPATAAARPVAKDMRVYGLHPALHRSPEVKALMESFEITPSNYAQRAIELNPNPYRARLNAFELDMEEQDHTAWRSTNAVTSDYFNYGFDEQSFREYAAEQVALRAKHKR